MQTIKSIFKLTIISMLLLITLSAVSAGDVNDTVAIDVYEEVCVNDDLCEIQDVQISQEEIILHDENELYEFDLIYINDSDDDYISLDDFDNYEEVENTHCEPILNDVPLNNVLNDVILYENSLEDINCDSTANNTHDIKMLLNENIFLFEIISDINMIKISNFEFNLFKFEEGLKNVHLLDHDILIYDCEAVLNYIIKEKTISCSNKSNTDFAYCIDNSIVGSDLTVIFIPKSFFITSKFISIQFINIYQAFFPNEFN